MNKMNHKMKIKMNQVLVEYGVQYDREIWKDLGLVNDIPTLWCNKCGKAITKTQQLVDTHLSMNEHKRHCGQLIIDDD